MGEEVKFYAPQLSSYPQISRQGAPPTLWHSQIAPELVALVVAWGMSVSGHPWLGFWPRWWLWYGYSIPGLGCLTMSDGYRSVQELVDSYFGKVSWPVGRMRTLRTSSVYQRPGNICLRRGGGSVFRARSGLVEVRREEFRRP